MFPPTLLRAWLFDRRSRTRIPTRCGALACVLALALAHGARAQAAPPASAPALPAYRARLLGVMDGNTGQPIEGVEVADIVSGMSALTTATGTVTLVFLPEGGSLVRLRKIGYESQTLTVSISPADTTPVTVVFQRAVELAAVVTTARGDFTKYSSALLQGFEERRHGGFGVFVSERELRDHDNAKVSDIVARFVPGLHIVRPLKSGSTAEYAVSARGQVNMMDKDPCYASVYLDGALIYTKRDSCRLWYRAAGSARVLARA